MSSFFPIFIIFTYCIYTLLYFPREHSKWLTGLKAHLKIVTLKSSKTIKQSKKIANAEQECVQ